MDLFRDRRSVRKFSDKSIPEEVIHQMKEVLLMAPTAMNAESCTFKFVTDKATIEKMQYARENEPYIDECELIVVICKNKNVQSLAYIEDVAIAASHLQLFCVTEKLGSCWIHLNARQSVDGGIGSEYVAKICGLPENLDPHCMLIIGYPAEEIHRKEVDINESARFI